MSTKLNIRRESLTMRKPCDLRSTSSYGKMNLKGTPAIRIIVWNFGLALFSIRGISA